MADPVSWLMIEPGWRVISADGQQVGRIEEITGDSNADIFDGLAVASTLWAHQRYVAAESVGVITMGEVHLLVDAAAMEGLPKYEEPAESAEIEAEKAGHLQRAEASVVHPNEQAHSTSFIHRVLEWFGLAGEALKDALTLAAEVRAGAVSPRELTEQAIARIERANPELNFLVTDCFEQALATEPEDGPFRGVPMLIKDLNETAGVRTTFSSRAFEHWVPDDDTAMVRRLKQAGFVILGKSNTPEFGTTCVTESDLNGACRNPWDTSRTPGGSSGGAAAAVAAGVLPLAQGSDGGGSIRIPASCCGLFGLKPSRGRVSPAPWTSGSLELAQNAGLSATVRDAAALLDVLAGYEWGDAHSATPPARPFLDEVGADPGRLRIALTIEPPIPYDVDPRVAAVARDAADALSALGHDVVEARPPWRDEALIELFARLWATGPAMIPVDPDLLMPLNRFLAERAHATSSVDFARAVTALQQLARRVVSFWQDVDVVLTPTLAKLPVPIGWVLEPEDPWEQFLRGGEFTPFTPIVNVTGQPAMSVPFGEVDGLPVGVQLIGGPESEAVLFRLAGQMEAAHPWKLPS